MQEHKGNECSTPITHLVKNILSPTAAATGCCHWLLPLVAFGALYISATAYL